MTTTEYCISSDGERFQDTSATTRESAIEDARFEVLHDRTPGDEAVVFVAEKRHAKDILSRHLDGLGERVCELIDEWLADEIGWDDPVAELEPADQSALGRLIVDFVESKGGFKAYGACNVTEHTVTVPTEEGGE